MIRSHPTTSRRSRAAFVLVTMLLSLAAFSFAQQAVETEDRAIRVVGHGVVYGQPDIATVELGVTATDPDAGAAVDQIDSLMRAVLETLTSLGVPPEDIRTVSYNIWREEHFPREGEEAGQPVFRAQHTVAVELEGAKRAGEILAAAVDAGANAVGGITFGFSNPAELEARARAAAVEDARMRASQLATAAGVTLGEPMVIEEITAGGGPVPYLDRALVASQAAPISPGELSVEVRVAVTYSIE